MAKTKKIESIYNPVYKNRFGNIAESMNRIGSENLQRQAPSYYKGSFRDTNPDNLIDYSGLDYEDVQKRQDIEREENRSHLSKIGETISNFASSLPVVSWPRDIYNFTANDGFRNAWRLAFEKGYQINASSHADKAMNYANEISDLTKFKDFITNYRTLKDLYSQLNAAQLNNMFPLENEIRQKISDFNTKFPDFYKTVQEYEQLVKTNPTLQKLVYDVTPKDKNPINMDQIGGTAFWNRITNSKSEISWDPNWQGAASDLMSGNFSGAAAKVFGKTAQSTIGKIGDIFSNVASYVGGAWTGENVYSNSVRQAIAQNAFSNEQLNQLKKYDIKNISNIEYDALSRQIEDQVSSLNRNLKEEQETYRQRLDTYRNGNFWFNPKKIDPNFRKRNQENELFDENTIVENLLYSIPEMGSSFSSFYNFATNLGLQGVGGIVASNMLKSSNPAIAAAGLATMLGTQIGSLYTSIKMREDESAAEQIDAYTNRLVEALDKNEIAYGSVKDQILNYAKKIGVNTEGLDDNEIFQLGLAYNVKTDDPEYERIKNEARKGLSTVMSQNNALGYMDYLQVLPFAPQAGKIIKGYGNGIFRNMAYKNSMRYTNRDLQDAAANIIDRSVSSTIKKNSAQIWLDKKINKALNAIPGKIENKIAIRNYLANASKRAGKLLNVAAMEGVEEGQQMFIQNRYQSGMYDDNADVDFGSFINIKSLMNDAMLSIEAPLAYFGLNFGDPLNGDAELRKTMEIGAATGFLFPLIGTATNIWSSEDNIRGDIQNFKNDRNLIKIVSDNYGLQNDDMQSGILFDAFSKGKRLNQVEKAFNDFKHFKNPEVVSDPQIDDAIKLAKYVYSAYETTSDERNDLLDKLNIQRDSEDHKELVKQSSLTIKEFDQMRQNAENSSKRLDEYINSIVTNLNSEEYLKNNPSLSSFLQKLESGFTKQRILDEQQIHKKRNNLRSKKQVKENQIQDLINEGPEAPEYESKLSQLHDQVDDINRQLDSLVDPQTDFQDYKKSVIKIMLLKQKQNQLKNLYAQFKNQEENLKQVQEIGDLDIDSDNIDSMRRQLKSEINSLQKTLQESGLNLAQLEKENIFKNDNELNDYVSVDALNNSVLSLEEPLASSYLLGFADPRKVLNLKKAPKYENLSEDQKQSFQRKIKNKYQEENKNIQNINYEKEWEKQYKDKNKKLRENSKRIDDLDELIANAKEKDLELYREDRASIFRDTAIQLIENDINDRFRRKRVVEQENEQSKPVTNDTLDAAENGDVESQQKIIQESIESEPEIESVEQGDNLNDLPTDSSPLIEDAERKFGFRKTLEQEEEEKQTSDEIQKTILKQSGKLNEDENFDPDELFKQAYSIQLENVEDQVQEKEDSMDENISPYNEVDQIQNVRPEQVFQPEELDVPKTKAVIPDQEDGQSPKNNNVDSDTGIDKSLTHSEDEHDDIPSDRELNEELEIGEDSINISEDKSLDISQDIQLSQLGINDAGSLTINDIPATRDFILELTQEQIQLNGIDNSLYIPSDLQNDDLIPTSGLSVNLYTESKVSNKEIGIPFNYRPDATEPMVYESNGKTVFNKPLATGKQLSEKLSTPGWIDRVQNKYYIVSGKNSKDPNTLTVAMILQDPDDSEILYSVASRRPGVANVEIIERLMFQNVDKETYSNNFADLVESEVKFINRNLSIDSRITEEQFKTLPEYRNSVQNVMEKARLNSPKYKGAKILTRNQINSYIERLINQRQQIIDAYCFKQSDGTYVIPNEVRTDVVPQNLSISNGKFNNQKEYIEDSEISVPIFSPLYGEERGFGLHEDTELMSRQIEKGEVQFGVGTGRLGFIPFEIRPINGSPQIYTIPGKGLSGKIYIVVPKENLPGSNKKESQIPLMLSEEKFQETGAPLQEDEIIEAFTENWSINPEVKLTQAELVFRLITESLNKNVFDFIQNYDLGFVNSELLRDFFLNLMIHEGTDTLLAKQEFDQLTGLSLLSKEQQLCHKLPYYSDKQIANITTETGSYLYIGDEEDGKKILRRYDRRELFPGKMASESQKLYAEKNRKRIIHLISKNFHWNTDINTMTDVFPGWFLAMLDRYFFEEDGLNVKGNRSHYRISNRNVFDPFGVPQLTFNYEDFYNEDGSRKNPLVMAWMIKTGKLKTDVGTNKNDLFKDPFVFPNGVSVPSKEESLVLENAINKTKQTATKQSSEISIKPMFAIPQEYKGSGVMIYTTKEEQQEFLNNLNKIQQKKDGEKYNGYYFITVENQRKKNPVKLKEELKEKLLALEKQLNVKIDERSWKAFNWVKKYNHSNVFLTTREDGVASIVSFAEGQKIQGTGVFSTIPGEGKIDMVKAKSQLTEMLGLDSNQIIVTSAVERSVSGDIIYGATRLAMNIVNDEITGQISLNTNSGSGVHYHEAFHYVNLLLHNDAIRNKIYEEYRKKNRISDNTSNEEIEELLAEDFRYWMLNQDAIQQSPRIIRFFKNLINFIKTWISKPKIIRGLYRDIKSGKYSGQKINENSAKDFISKYPSGAYFRIPGVSKEQINDFKYISDYHQYYQCAKYLTNMLMDNMDLTSIQKIQSVSSEDFNDLLNVIQIQIETTQDPITRGLLQDIVENPNAFKKAVIDILKSFNVKAVTDKKQLDSGNQTGKDSGDVADNIWDIDRLQVSKKINVGFKAKLFFSTIPKLKAVLNKDGSREFIRETDELFNSPLFVPFSQTWNKIIDDLWECDSFDKIDPETGTYDQNSIMYTVDRLSNQDGFYVALKEKMSPLCDPENEDLSIENKIELKTQIFNTIVSSKNHILTLQISNPTTQRSNSHQVGDLNQIVQSSKSSITEDIKKSWSILDSSFLQSKFILPKIWSKNLAASSGILKQTENGTKINHKWVDKFQELVIKLNRSIKHKNLQESRQNILNILGHMGIPFDNLSLDIYIDNQRNLLGEQYPDLQIIKDLMNTKGKGSILSFINQIRAAIQNNTIIVQKGKNNDSDKHIDQIYTGYSKVNKGSNIINKLSIAYAKAHPSSSEFSVTGADGVQIYPFNSNNFMSDRVRQINNNTNNIIESITSCSYGKSSIVLEVARQNAAEPKNEDTKIKLNTFVCLRDTSSNQSADYFGITPMEDYISKMVMTFHKHLIMPTMADKKTWYSISSSRMSEMLGEDLLDPFITISEEVTDENGTHIREVRTEDNARKTLSSATLNIFKRYLNDEIKSLEEYYSEDNIKYLLSHPKKLLINFHGKIKNIDAFDGSGKVVKFPILEFGGNGGMFRYFYDTGTLEIPNAPKGLNVNQLLEYLYQLESIENSYLPIEDRTDGYSKIRSFLTEYKRWLNESANKEALINSILIRQIEKEIENLNSNENIKLVQRKGNSLECDNVSIPQFMINYYTKQLQKLYDERDLDIEVLPENAIYSLISNHVIRTIISVIESEKVFTGDPAMYKWVYYKHNKLPEKIQNNLTVNSNINGVNHKIVVRQLKVKDVDKIKRLGAVLSPGTNLKSDWSEYELKTNYLKYFHTNKFTFMNVKDINAKSIYLDIISNAFKKQEILDEVRNEYNSENSDEILQKYEKYFEGEFSILDVYNKIYSDDGFAEKLYQNFPKEVQNEISNKVNSAIYPYTDINVSDAQVCLRPEMYRKLRISIGEWSFEEDVDGFSDEKAYEILENSSDWINNPNLYKIVRKLQLKPLKMSYFGNDPSKQVGNTNVLVPVYNKMAMFPMFKFLCTSTSGEMLYNRMNKPGNELDMIGFESSVKVGCNQEMYSPFKDEISELDLLNEQLNLDSNSSVNYADGTIRFNNDPNTIAVQIQDMDNLHLQLNTDAHETSSRAIGTQMAKICFSNIIDDFSYGHSENKKLGSEIKSDIMNIINAMTSQGRNNILKKFFIKDSVGKYNIPNYENIKKYLLSVCENNNIGSFAEDIIFNGGSIASLTSRLVFEQSISTLVNGEIVDINTNGGSAVQQSVFGFTGYSQKNVETYDSSKGKYQMLNQGKELKWYKEDGSMEVMLSLNFFKHVIPKKYQSSYFTMRQWLIENNIIGTNANPFGVGYRIPTQGMSSTFGFEVVDVLPEMSGDLMVVPKEFTAQTGSDYDVDKIYLATFSYTVEEDNATRTKLSDLHKQYTEEEYVNEDPKALKNKLLQNFLDIITDYKNLSNSRASIDTLTSILKNDILPYIQQESGAYPNSMYELIPSFQAIRKMEYSTGKSGIGPFALNVTNHALTQLIHLNIHHDITFEKYFNPGQLDDIIGTDGYRISDWLSAMVNAHVDVAKDPYILALNVNPATYNMTNYLLRSGMGMKTFTFMAQPILKKFASKIVANNGMYGLQLGGKPRKMESNDNILRDLRKQYASNFLVMAEDFIKTYGNSSEFKKEVDKIKYFMDQLSRIVNYKKTGNARLYPDWDQLFSYPDANVFDVNLGEQMLSSNMTTRNQYMRQAFYQVMVATMYLKNKYCADKLAGLITQSRIDTKKFGNNIISQLNFLNGYNQFKYDTRNNNTFYIKNKEKQSDDSDKTYPLRTYFEKTFLDKKLKYATSVTKMILSNQTFTATKLYSEIFNSCMISLFGESPYVMQIVNSNGEIENKMKVGYSPITNDKTVQSIGKAIDSIMKHRAMLYMSNKNTKDINNIDFTIDSDENIVANKIKQLIFGDENLKSIPERVASIKSKIVNLYREYSSSNKSIPDWLLQICNNDGSIKNDFLNYLNPIVTNNNEPNRLLLMNSSMDIDADYKRLLSSAFNELFEISSNDETQQEMIQKIHDLAQDLVLYSYYSSYNNTDVNQYFNIVPIEYRKQYDLSVAKVLRNYKLQENDDFISHMMLNDTNDPHVENDDRVTQIYNFVKMVARNFWYDDNIVTPYTNIKGNNNIKSANTEQIVNVTKLNGYNVKTTFATPATNVQFLKINSNGYIYLFQKIGEQRFIPKDSNSKPAVRYKTIYQIIPKFGLHSGKNTFYEFYSESNSNSAFDENNIPDSANVSINELNEALNLNSKEFEKTSTFKYYKKDYSHIEFIPSINLNSIDNVDETISETHKSNPIDGNNEQSQKYCIDNSDYIIENIDNQKQIIEEIKTVSKEKDGVAIYIKMNNVPDTNVTSSEIEQYINKQMDVYRTSLLSNGVNDNIEQRPLTEIEINKMVKERKNKYLTEDKDYIKSEIKQNNFAEKLSDLLTEIGNNVQIGSILIDDTNEVSDIIKRVADTLLLPVDKFDTGRSEIVYNEKQEYMTEKEDINTFADILSSGNNIVNDMLNQTNINIQNNINSIPDNIKDGESTIEIGAVLDLDKFLNFLTDDDKNSAEEIKNHCEGE